MLFQKQRGPSKHVSTSFGHAFQDLKSINSETVAKFRVMVNEGHFILFGNFRST